MLCLDQKMTAYYKTNFLVWSLFLSANISFAQPINYQGRLSDKSGTNVNGTKNFALRIFDAKTGGKQIYEENVGAVAVNEGAYSFNFGESGKSVSTATETIAFADGEKQIFNYIVKNKPITGGIKISGGGYSWAESGSSDANFFTATANKNSGAISAIFLTGAPAAGSEIAIAYNHNSNGVMGALSRGGQAWLEISVGGETLSPRERLVAVPFAKYAEHLINYSPPETLLYHAKGSGDPPNQLVVGVISNRGGNNSSDGWSEGIRFHLYIPQNTKKLMCKMKFKRSGNADTRLRINNRIGEVYKLKDPVKYLELDNSIYGWQDLILDIKNFVGIGGGDAAIHEMWIYTKND
jgi:hypothetical protein